ncbi:Hsp33 family molecular chaperone HslO [Gloeobacter kilaueensis]|uniref:33 kDa chaperonin n=1 Tax=Gloeobacter kilaueensis (strain ATCC BAA-2537 / CCAP 1431/1 / ULC 316 / JS1) TaxID=1183438 RepID=U5QC05_GLOK1|nr:Hsp33 family molecular chaperone HslO [Gloeobacter kilaueensis]AGY56343.1 Hsp33 chaperonin [Gloeobacter kilaueensis JS1]
MADQLVRATAADGRIRAVGVLTTRLTAEARERHKLSYVATAALGRTMAAGLLLASNLKQGTARVNLRVQGDGPLGGILVDAGADGTVRGYVKHPEVELPPSPKGKLDVGRAVGANGFLYVVKDLGYGYPFSGTTELVSGEIGDDITHYLVTSEQIPSALLLGVFVGAEGVEAAGGLLLQVMPGPAGEEDEQLASTLEARLAKIEGFTPLVRQGKRLPQIFSELLEDLQPQIFADVQLVRFHCQCSSERVLRALKLMGEAELLDMIEKDGGAEATCHFCNQVYQVGANELEDLVEQLRSEREASAQE